MNFQTPAGKVVDVKKELDELRRLEKIALAADNAVLVQRLKIFPAVEHTAAVAMGLAAAKDDLIIKAVHKHQTKKAAATELGISPRMLYNHLRRLNGRVKHFTVAVMLVALSSSAQLTSPKAVPTGDKPMRIISIAPAAVVLPPQSPSIGIGLTWTKSSSTNVITYNIYATDTNGAKRSDTSIGNVSEYVLSGLSNGPPWKIEVTATANDGTESLPATLIFQNQSVWDYFMQTSPTVTGGWVDTWGAPFSSVTNPTPAMEFTRIRVHRRRQ